VLLADGLHGAHEETKRSIEEEKKDEEKEAPQPQIS